jgi:hypothetical protein
VNVLDDEPYNDVHELQTAVAKLALQDNGTKSFTARTADRGKNSNSRRRNDFMLLFSIYIYFQRWTLTTPHLKEQPES